MVAAGQACHWKSCADDRGAHADVALGDQHVDGREAWTTGAGASALLLVAAADEKRGGAACGEGDAKHYNTRGFHNASLTLLRDTTAGRAVFAHLMRLRGARAELRGFQQQRSIRG